MVLAKYFGTPERPDVLIQFASTLHLFHSLLMKKSHKQFRTHKDFMNSEYVEFVFCYHSYRIHIEPASLSCLATTIDCDAFAAL